MNDLDQIFEQLKGILKKYEEGLEGRKSIINSKTQSGKASYHIYGKKEVVILDRKPQQTYVVGIIKQKHFIGFYSMPVYSHPKSVFPQNPDLKKFLIGKSCFNVKYLDDGIEKDIERIIKIGIEI